MCEWSVGALSERSARLERLKVYRFVAGRPTNNHGKVRKTEQRRRDQGAEKETRPC